MLLSLLSTLISSIALVGVAISLYLQGRQLRSAQVQSTAASHIELLKFAIEHPTLAGELAGNDDPDDLAKQVALNWHISYLQMAYSNKSITDQYLRSLAKYLLSTNYARSWWAGPGQSYGNAATRSDRRFFAIFNEEFLLLKAASEAADTGFRSPDKTAGSPPPSS
jgi:hypothetical protein